MSKKDDLESTAIEQLMEQIRKQDDLIHGWTKTLVVTQGGLLAGAGFLWNASNMEFDLKLLGTVLIALLALAAGWTCTGSIRSEARWQGRYISYLKSVTGNEWIYRDFNPVKETGGITATNAMLIRVVICVIWGLALLTVLMKILFSYFCR